MSTNTNANANTNTSTNTETTANTILCDYTITVCDTHVRRWG